MKNIAEVNLIRATRNVIELGYVLSYLILFISSLFSTVVS